MKGVGLMIAWGGFLDLKGSGLLFLNEWRF
jgi:hypothetical protein